MQWEKILTILGLCGATAAVATSGMNQARQLIRRALSDCPTGTYAPGFVQCPNTTLLRPATGLSRLETDWVSQRKQQTNKALTDLLNRANLTDFDIASFMENRSPTIALAFSGGGFRAMLNGGGVFAAFDSRTPNSTEAGHMGGLVQSTTYIAGLSGGSWLVGSIVINNFTTVPQLQAAPNLWDLRNSILTPSGDLQIIDNIQYYDQLHQEVTDKQSAGFKVSLTDYWARAISRLLIDFANGGPGVTFSSIAKTDVFQSHEMPFPIVVADARSPNQILISSNTTVYEFNPFEFGSFDPTLYAFMPLEYIGTNVTNGNPEDPQKCMRGYDNAGFVLGTSSSLFNLALVELQQVGSESILRNFAMSIVNDLSSTDIDIADYEPNPFFGVNPDINPSANVRDLTLVDGGLDNENIPLEPLIQPPRNVDVIFAIDSSADTDNNWPNGTSLVSTYERSLSPMQNHTAFPAIPDVNTFINLGLNTRPTFFGCDMKNITGNNDAPLIVYIPNTPIISLSNTSTFQLSYTTTQRDTIIRNGYNVATRGNGTLDKDWPACAACAIIRRSQERANEEQTTQCQSCFQKYCWDGTTNSTPPAGPFEPTIAIAGQADSRAPRALQANIVSISALVLGVVWLGLQL